MLQIEAEEAVEAVEDGEREEVVTPAEADTDGAAVVGEVDDAPEADEDEETEEAEEDYDDGWEEEV